MPYYNTTSPTPGTKNNINDIAVSFGIRDFLLLKNLTPTQFGTVDSFAKLNNIQSPHVGEPFTDTGSGGVNQIPNFFPIETNGILFYEINILPNKFKNLSSTNDDLVNIETVTQLQGPYGDVDYPQGSQSYPEKPNEEVTKYGLLAKSIAMSSKNKPTNASDASLINLYLNPQDQHDMANYIDDANSYAEYLSVHKKSAEETKEGYLDKYGKLNFGNKGKANDVSNINTIGSVLGGGLGLSSNSKGTIGTSNSFDLRSSLAGRVLGMAGAIDDTRLGMIGGQQLTLALANNAAFNVQQELLGKLNVQDNVLSLIKTGTLAGFRPNYQITVPSGTFAKIADTAAGLLGFTLPKSYLNDSGSIFQSESGGNIGNVQRANSMLQNTGKGQLVALVKNAKANIEGTGSYDNPLTTSSFRSGYAPGYEDHKHVKQINGNRIYAYSNENGSISNILTSTSYGAIPNFNVDRLERTRQSGFPDFENMGFGSYNESNIKTPSFTWTSDKPKALNISGKYDDKKNYIEPVVKPIRLADRKSLIDKTQKLFDSTGMKSIVSSKGNMDITPNQLQTAVVGGGISKGNPVLRGDRFTKDANGNSTGIWDGITKNKTAEETYCRAWTTTYRYNQVNKLVRHRGLDNDGVSMPFRENYKGGSVLEDTGFVKIAPYDTDNLTVVDAKKYMLSIENLAWHDMFDNLLPVEKGPGDLISGKHGRIMWFPPYDITFNENVSVNWESNSFIGRGENIYTYNNTERSGTLNFKIIVDHPTYVNALRDGGVFGKTAGPDDHYMASFFAGCVDPDSAVSKYLTGSESSDIQSRDIKNIPINQLKTELPLEPISIYFPNDQHTLDGFEFYENGKDKNGGSIDYSNYNGGNGLGAGPIASDETRGQTQAWVDNNNFGLNGPRSAIKVGDATYAGWYATGLLPAIEKYLKASCPSCVIYVDSYASPQGREDANISLADKRNEYILTKLKKELYTTDLEIYKNPRIKKGKSIPITADKSDCNPKTGSAVDTEACKKDRKVVLRFEYDVNLAAEAQGVKEVVTQTATRTVKTTITNRFYDESKYFTKLKQTDEFIFDKFREKIKYFHPAFHSTTPEGLNSRLTFLHQCTRQGPTLENENASNLAFGRAPVCILRIGDFYNTKIVIDSLGIDYEPLVWDLNPEGIGVQPMIANVNLSFKFIGGSTLESPINKLQNALSFNYYANSHVYDVRADYVAKTPPPPKNEKDVTDNNKTTSDYSLINGFNEKMENGVEKIELGPETIKNVDQVASVNQQPVYVQTSEKPAVAPTTPPTPIVVEDKNKDLNLIINANLTRKFSPDLVSGSYSFEISFSSVLDNDYDAKLIIYDFKNNNHDLMAVKILKNKKSQSFSGTLDLNKDNFEFTKDNKSINYQAKLDIIGLKQVTSKFYF